MLIPKLIPYNLVPATRVPPVLASRPAREPVLVADPVAWVVPGSKRVFFERAVFLSLWVACPG